MKPRVKKKRDGGGGEVTLMDAALDGTSVGAVSAGASSFSFFAAARVAASARLADLHKRISKGNHKKCTRERDIIETIGRRRFPIKRKNRKRERDPYLRW